MESLWPGMWDAVYTIVNPRLDKYVMFDEEKETVKKALCKEPEISLANASWMIDAARTIREIVNGTKAEVYEIAAESGVDYLKKLGLDIAEDVAEDVDKVAATTTCLFFGFLDGATTISESCGGGGGNNGTTRTSCPLLVDAIRWPRLCMHRGTDSGDDGSM